MILCSILAIITMNSVNCSEFLTLADIFFMLKVIICCSKSYFNWVIVSKKELKSVISFISYIADSVFCVPSLWCFCCCLVGFFCCWWCFMFFYFLNHHNTHTFREQEQQLAAEIPEHLDIMKTTCSKYQYFFSIANRFFKTYFSRRNKHHLLSLRNWKAWFL